MKIRTDFVTNSSSSSFVTITVELKNGTIVENEYPMEDIGFHESLYTLTEEELRELLSGHSSVGELIDKLDAFYDRILRDGEEDPLEEIEFADISEITISDKWDCDGEEAGMLIAEYADNEWNLQWLDADEEDDEEDDEAYGKRFIKKPEGNQVIRAEELERCMFCERKLLPTALLRKRDPNGVVSQVCARCVEEYDLNDWETV